MVAVAVVVGEADATNRPPAANPSRRNGAASRRRLVRSIAPPCARLNQLIPTRHECPKTRTLLKNDVVRWKNDAKQRKNGRGANSEKISRRMIPR